MSALGTARDLPDQLREIAGLDRPALLGLWQGCFGADRHRRDWRHR